MSRPEWIEVGRVSRPHGVHGEVRIVPSTDNPERFSLGSILYARPERLGVAGPRVRQQIRLTVANVRGDEAFPILRLGEVGDRVAAEALRGYVLEIPSSALPELEADEFYPFDLIGLEVRDEDGAVIGEVTDVLDSPAHALLLIAGERDSTLQEPDRRGSSGELVPFVAEAVPIVAVADGYMVLASSFRETLRSPPAPDPDRIEPK